MSDAAFFARYPKRKHRVRYATRPEIAALEIAGSKSLALPSVCGLYEIVRRVTSTYYARRFIPFLKKAPASTSMKIWLTCCSTAWRLRGLRHERRRRSAA